MILPFFKYQGTGNDFVMVDNRDGRFSDLNASQIEAICHRRFGIGADGLILLSQDTQAPFFMDYFNSDGKRSSMCGNGGRCIAQFAKKLGMADKEITFRAADGMHEAVILDDSVRLKMTLPQGFRKISETDFWIHTGSPHYVRFVASGLDSLNVKQLGAEIRYSEPWKKEGTNVNFVERKADGTCFVRTYERGVEDETWSCGTGVTAVAEIISRLHPESSQPIRILTPGGELNVHCREGAAPWLEGKAVFVFEGKISL